MQESGEMYLETILVLGLRNNMVRSIDVAAEMNFSKPSISRAMSKLREEQCIVIDRNGAIALTEKGRAIALKIYERHQVLSKLLMAIGVDEETALADACRMEHVISDVSFIALKEHMSKVMKL